MAISAATNKAPTYLNKLSEQLMPYGWFGYGIHNCINCTKTITSPAHQWRKSRCVVRNVLY